MRHFSELGASAERVVDAAEALIQHAGYNGFSYDDVARQVGIRKPSIHHHFPTKAELVATVAQRYTHRFREQLLGIEGRHATARKRLQAYAELFQRTFEHDRRLCVCGMLGAEADALPEGVTSEVERFFAVNLDWLAQTIAAGQADGSLRQDTPSRALAEMVLSALEGAMVVARAGSTKMTPHSVGATLVSSLLAR